MVSIWCGAGHGVEFSWLNNIVKLKITFRDMNVAVSEMFEVLIPVYILVG